MVLSIVTALARNLVMMPTAMLRSRVAKDAEVLALRHENAVLRRQIARARYEPADRMRMILAYRGHHLTDAQILRQIGVDRVHWRFGVSGPTSGDPYRAFVGDPNGDESTGTGFGVYYPRVALVARANHLTVLAAGMNVTPAYLYRELAAGHPAEAWIDYLYRNKPSRYYRAYDGRWILYAGPAEHAIVLTGVTPNGVYVNDPARGSYWISKKKFEAGYATYHDMAVVVS